MKTLRSWMKEGYIGAKFFSVFLVLPLMFVLVWKSHREHVQIATDINKCFKKVTLPVHWRVE